MCEFCQGYRQAARDLSQAERTGSVPQATPCPYRKGEQFVPWLAGYMTYLESAKALGEILDDPMPQDRWKCGYWHLAGNESTKALGDVLRAAREGGR